MEFLLIGRNEAVNAANLPSSLQNGGIAVFKENGTLLQAGDTVTESTSISIVQGVRIGELPIVSPNILGTGIKRVTVQRAVNPTRDTVTIGFNGTSGNLTLNEKSSLYFKVSETNQGYTPYPYQAGNAYLSAGTPIPALAANALINSFNTSVKLGSGFAAAELLLNLLFTDTTATAIVVNGSPVIVMSGTHNITSGMVVRIGHATNNNTFPVYYVKQVNGNTVVLTRPVLTPTLRNGEVQTSVPIGRASAPDSSVAAGLFIRSFNVNSSLIVNADGFSTTPIAHIAGVKAINSGEIIAQKENVLLGNRTFYSRITLPQTSPTYTDVNINYITLSIEYMNTDLDEKRRIGVIDASNVVTVAYPDTTEGVTRMNELLSLLNPYFASTPLQFNNLTV